MLDWLKWRVAPKEMAELDRWRIQWEEHRRWLAEFPEVAMALDHLRDTAEDKASTPIFVLRGEMREAKSLPVKQK